MIISEDIRDWVIYKITSPSNRVYIGKSAEFNKRKASYKYTKAFSQPILNGSILKYGFENHTMEIIESFKSNISWANGKEMFWIRTHMSNKGKYPEMRGMNLTDGGDGMIGYKYSEESKKKMSLAKKGKPSHMKGKKKSAEAIANFSKARKGITSAFKGKRQWSDEQIAKMKGRSVGHKFTKGHSYHEKYKEKYIEAARKQGKKILAINMVTNEVFEFPSKREAHRETGVARNVINSSLIGESMNFKYSFQYK